MRQATESLFMTVIVFNQRVKHGMLDFIPNKVNYGMADDAASFFVSAGWASATDEAADITYREDEIEFDAETRFANTARAGQLVIHDGDHGAE